MLERPCSRSRQLAAAGRASAGRAVPPRPTLSLTLPGDPCSAPVARAAVGATLRAHRLDEYLWPAVLVASELVAVAAGVTPGCDLYLALRPRGGGLRVLVWDQHPPRHPACDARRRRALWLLEVVVDDWGGEWGCDAAEESQRGVKTWADLPR